MADQGDGRSTMMTHQVVVHFALDTVPGMSRHRVSVWDADGGLLCGPSAEIPDDVAVSEGTTLFVEASVPVETARNQTPKRDVKRWRLRACAEAHAVLTLGPGRTRGMKGIPGIEIRVDGAEHVTRTPASG
jgi:hypothetical protein